MTTIKSRAEWNARPWMSYVNLDWSRVTKFIVHINDARDGARNQSPRSIQDYCMDTKGHSDVDYNELERDGVVYLGRGDHVGGHTYANNSTSYGICVIYGGVFNDNDKRALRDRYAYACRRAGRTLEMLGHRDAPSNVGTTDCPGDVIDAWVHAGMPAPGGEGDDMFCNFGDTGEKVRAMQLAIIRAGFDLSPWGGADGDYGNGTAGALAALIGGDGRTYQGAQFDQLMFLAYGKGLSLPGPQGPQGPPGKTPTSVELDLSGVKVTVPVTGAS